MPPNNNNNGTDGEESIVYGTGNSYTRQYNPFVWSTVTSYDETDEMRKEREEKEAKAKKELDDAIAKLEQVNDAESETVEMVRQMLSSYSIASYVAAYIKKEYESYNESVSCNDMSFWNHKTLADIFCATKSGDDKDLIYETHIETNLISWYCSFCDSGMRPIDEDYEIANGSRVCESCYEDVCAQCARCEEIYHNDDTRHIECWEDQEGVLDEETCENLDDNVGTDISLCNNCYNDVLEENLSDEGRESRNAQREMRNLAMTHPIIQVRHDARYKHASKEAGDTVASSRLWSCEIEHYSTDRKKAVAVYNNMPNGFGLSGDGSLETRGRISDGRHIDAPVEIQTSLLGGKKGEDTIRAFCKKLQDADSYVDRTCGLHIHIDLRDLHGDITSYGTSTPTKGVRKIANIISFYTLFEDCITMFLPANRRNNRFCKYIRGEFSLSRLAEVETFEDLMLYWYKTNDIESAFSHMREHYNQSRYYGMNLHAFFQHQNVEIRHHSGTLNAQKILEWVNLHTAIIDHCIKADTTLDTIQNDFESLQNEADDKKLEKFFDILNLTTESRIYFTARSQKFHGSMEYEGDMGIPDKKAKSLEELNEKSNVCVG
jgi:hypothetical protein